jgi:hypothetical protein
VFDLPPKVGVPFDRLRAQARSGSGAVTTQAQDEVTIGSGAVKTQTLA